MARPIKKGCDYFSHDKDMRNHRKVKALRAKFGQLQGYAMWCMFLEHLTGIENNKFFFNDLEIELLSGDFGVSTDDLVSFIEYCVKIGLLIQDQDVVYSQPLNERLQSVYTKRDANKVTDNNNPVPDNNNTNGREKPPKTKANEVQNIQNEGTANLPENVVSDNNNVVSDNNNEVSDNRSTQSKVKYSKVKEIDKSISENSDFDFSDFSADQITIANQIRKSIKNLQKKNLIENLEEIEERFFPGKGTAFTVEKFIEYFFKSGKKKFFGDTGTLTVFLNWERQMSIKKDSVHANGKNPLPPKSTPELQEKLDKFRILEGVHTQISSFVANSKASERKALTEHLIDKYGIEGAVRKIFTYWMKKNPQSEDCNTVENFRELEHKLNISDKEWKELCENREIIFK